MFATLAGGTVFYVIDLKDVYTQLSVEQSSQQLLTVNTHEGLFRCKRLIYGLVAAPAIFQSVMDQILRDIPNVSCYLNDILMKGATHEECKQTLHLVLARLNAHNVRINIDKCIWFAIEVQYSGFILNKESLELLSFKIYVLVYEIERLFCM